VERKNFFERFRKLLQNSKDRHDLGSIHDALILWYAENALGMDPEDVKERIVVDRKAEGVDAVLVDQRNYKLFLVSAKTAGNFTNTEKNLPENDVKSFAGGVHLLIRGVYKQRVTSELENLMDEYHELDRTGSYETCLLMLTLKKKPKSTKFLDELVKTLGRNTEKMIVDFEELFKFYNEHYLVMKAPPPKRISFEVTGNILKKEYPTESRVFTCKGKELAKIYNDYRERIFQENVRYSLGVRSKGINKQILETAKSKDRSKDFWYFNNGITIVCKGINEPTRGNVINLDNAQIINGAQTTYALYEALQEGSIRDDIEILVKAIEYRDREFVENVTLYTNSQNAIRLRDLCSNDEIQIRIQKVLMDTYQYFYERKRGEVDSLYPTREEKQKLRKLLGPKYRKRIISNENAAQAFLAMYLNKPAEAKSEKGRIFIRDSGGYYDEIFDGSDMLPEKLLLAWVLLKFVERYKKQYRIEYKKAEGLSGSKRTKVYKYDFLLHSEYFILNLLKDFLKKHKLDVEQDKEAMMSIIRATEHAVDTVEKCYTEIRGLLAQYIEKQREDPKYYHNKFFKNSGSIMLVRRHFKSRRKYVDLLLR